MVLLVVTTKIGFCEKSFVTVHPRGWQYEVTVVVPGFMFSDEIGVLNVPTRRSINRRKWIVIIDVELMHNQLHA